MQNWQVMKGEAQVAKHYAGARIRTLRGGEGWTQGEMATQLGISTSYLNQLENDQRPLSVTVLMALMDVFGVDASYFSVDRDARNVAALAEVFPEVPDDQIIDMVARYPDVVARLIAPPQQSESPFETVREYFYDRHNYIDELDRAGEKLAEELGPDQFRITRLAERLSRSAGISVNFRGNVTGARRRLDTDTGTLTLREGLTRGQLCFELALEYALLVLGERIDVHAEVVPEGPAREVARLGLAQYFAAAVTMPYTRFLEQAEAARYDIDQLSYQFSTSFQSTCHRLSTLQRAGQKGLPFFFVRTDRAGNISKRASATAFHFSRSGGSCPLWIIHRAFETPATVIRQVAGMPDGRNYFWVARYVGGDTRAFGQPRGEFAVALGCDLDQAHRLIYSDGLDLSADAATPIGPGCQLCPRERCPQRAFPYSGRELVVDLTIDDNENYRTR